MVVINHLGEHAADDGHDIRYRWHKRTLGEKFELLPWCQRRDGRRSRTGWDRAKRLATGVFSLPIVGLLPRWVVNNGLDRLRSLRFLRRTGFLAVLILNTWYIFSPSLI